MLMIFVTFIYRNWPSRWEKNSFGPSLWFGSLLS